jgi:hypothetical protein
MSRVWHPALAVLAVPLLASAAAPAAAQGNRSTRNVMALTGTVERTDTFSHSLTVKASDGLTHVIYVGPELEVFRELQKGDAVVVRIVESVIVEATPGAKLTSLVDTTNDAKKAPEAAQGDVLQQIKAVVSIESIDLPMQAIVYKGADNRRVQRHVSDPRLLEGLKAGDVIEITYTRERAIDLHRQP